MTAFATPEEAARDGTNEEYVRVVGVVIRGDEAVVAQVMNADSYPESYEVETVVCDRTSSGWEAGSSGNDNMKFIQTGDDRCTVVWWLEGIEGATGARIRLGDQEQVFAVRDGFFFAVFDEVPYHDVDWEAQWPRGFQGTGFYSELRIEEPSRRVWFHERPTLEGWVFR